jgi:hypothetical protein
MTEDRSADGSARGAHRPTHGRVRRHIAGFSLRRLCASRFRQIHTLADLSLRLVFTHLLEMRIGVENRLMTRAPEGQAAQHT